MSADVIDFQAARQQRGLPAVRSKRTREELLRLGRSEWIQQQLLKQIDEWGWDRDVPIVS
ncbi:hypothetical protein IM816_05960 [Luteibacter flocculans]|uniref:Uncharacterized protein n=1 Tax=Luteibacter flocculans TaxID=2780091 RepID=A0ABY4TA93_9GAMM|nr:hypothetical protein [Luteibacter flocculans]URL59641.1 hypothetical protein IM816_05960 [Luteibacter flocculans]